MGRGMVEPVMSRAGAEKRRVGAGARVCATLHLVSNRFLILYAMVYTGVDCS
jgi:hypothetical protein